MNAKQAQTHHVIQAEVKASSGKGAARAARNAGLVPAVIYAPGSAPEHVSVNARDLAKAIQIGHFYTHVQELNIGGKILKVLPKALQRHPVSDLVIHADFMRYDAKRMVNVNVTVNIVGEELSPGIKAGGVLQVIETELEVVCRADSIPQDITVDVSGLDIGDSIHLSSIKLPEGVKSAVTDRDLTIASVVSTRTSAVAEDEAADAAAAASAAEVPASNQKNDGKPAEEAKK